jgi:hypothetical protein
MASENREGRGQLKTMLKQTRRNVIRNLFIVCGLLFVAVFMLSCKSGPKAPDAVLPDAVSIPLDTGALAYSFVDIRNARPILNHVDFMGMSDKDFKQILDRSHSAIIAVHAPNDERRFQLTAWGNFPSSGAKMAFGASKSWKKMSSAEKADYWYSATGQISVAMTAKNAFVLAVRIIGSPDIPLDPFPTGDTTIPEGFNTFRQGAIFSCWLNDPGPYIQQKLGEMGIPLAIAIEQLFIRLSPVQEQAGTEEPLLYEALLKIQVPSAVQARAMTTLFTIAQRSMLSPDISGGNDTDSIAGDSSAVLKYLLLSNPPVQDGKNIFFKTNALSEEETALLFRMLSL